MMNATANQANLRRQSHLDCVAKAPEHLAELRRAIASFGRDAAGAAGSLKELLLGLAASAGSCGLAEVKAIAREAAVWIGSGPAPDEPAMTRLERMITALEAAFARRPLS
ncbi:MAG TPA: hypothetical protein VFW66_02745 [Gemmatimonadales bacterium]|nr:hypothetical protein [Gemmatimonadales bacterium]